MGWDPAKDVKDTVVDGAKQIGDEIQKDIREDAPALLTTFLAIFEGYDISGTFTLGLRKRQP